MPFMVAPASFAAPSLAGYRGAIAVDPVGLRAQPPPWGAEVSEGTLREALVNSLAVRGLFVQGEPRYALSATLERADQKLDGLLLGLDITVDVTMSYELRDSRTGAAALRREIGTAYTRPFRYLSAKERSQEALEAAIRRNIASFLDGLRGRCRSRGRRPRERRGVDDAALTRIAGPGPAWGTLPAGVPRGLEELAA